MMTSRTSHVDLLIDQNVLKRLRMRIDTEDPMYPRMKKLKIKGKELIDLPLEVFGLTELEVLDLSPERESCINYRLTQVPIHIRLLQGLRALMLDTNELDRIPPEVCLLVKLERLSLSNNNLRELPENIGGLRNLRSLHLANNRISQLPKSITDLRSLQFLDVGSNRLESLPPDISKLHNLESLVVVFNHLKDLPDSLCEIASLHMVWVGYNRISRLPRQFGKLINLDWGFRHTSSMALDGNPMRDPPPEICLQGVNAISEYFARSRERS